MQSLWQTTSLSLQVILTTICCCSMWQRNKKSWTSWLQSHNVATLIHPQIGIVVLKNPPTISSFNFFAHSAVSRLLISQPWSFTRPWCIIYLSVFPAWLFLDLRSEGEIKQTPFWSWQGLQSLNLRAVSPAPGLTRGRVRQRCSLLQASEGGKKKHNREGYLVFLWPPKPSEMKRLSIFTKEDHFSRGTPVQASKLSRNFNQRQITVYCVLYSAPLPQFVGAKGASNTQIRNGSVSLQALIELCMATEKPQQRLLVM